MSLARTLLNATTESVEAIDTTGFEYGDVATESFYVDAACEALVTDIFTIDKAYHVADIMGEVQVIKEGADGQAILEGMISNGIEKLKNVFRKFWAKLQAWFASVKKYFKSLFLKGKDFVKEFSKEITDKKATGFKYHAFKYTLSKGDSAGDKIMNEVNRRLDICAAGIKKSNDARDAEDIKKAVADIVGSSNVNVDGMKSSSDYQEATIKAIGLGGATTTSELTDELKKAYRDGEEAAQDFEEFESNSKSEMMDLVESADKTIKQIEKDEKAFEKDVNGIIKALDSVKKSDNENAYKVAQKLSSYASALLTLGKIPSTEKVNAYREAANAFRSILGSFVRFKPAKEGAEVDENEELEGSDAPVGESLIEAAMRLI